jgi:DNA-binding NtrC family response regulator
VAGSDTKVLITGESGVGKDLIARHVHFHSTQSASAFVAVNCAGVPESLLESELFGHAKGSFTDAVRHTAGKLRLGHNGTFFLDVVHIRVPPLRERPADIKALVLHLLPRAGRKIRFSDEALCALEPYRWPGNVRELQHVVERLIWTGVGDVIGPEDLPVQMQPGRAERVLEMRERRRQLADELYTPLTEGTVSFWEHVHPLFLARDLTRRDIRDLVGLGLTTTLANYRAVVRLFGMLATDYQRFLGFLTTHDCVVDFHPYRSGGPNGGAGGRVASQNSDAHDSRLPRSRVPVDPAGDRCL